MTSNKAQSIKNWISNMGFKLDQSHVVNNQSKKINYYTLDNFGVYEEIMPSRKKDSEKKQRFISWSPWGVELEVKSVRDLSKAYADFLEYNPDVAVS